MCNKSAMLAQTKLHHGRQNSINGNQTRAIQIVFLNADKLDVNDLSIYKLAISAFLENNGGHGLLLGIGGVIFK